jgi:hypothetical protein
MHLHGLPGHLHRPGCSSSTVGGHSSYDVRRRTGREARVSGRSTEAIPTKASPRSPLCHREVGVREQTAGLAPASKVAVRRGADLGIWNLPENTPLASARIFDATFKPLQAPWTTSLGAKPDPVTRITVPGGPEFH